jgi:hypothetical protein
VRDALYDLMDTFGERAKEAYRKKVALLREQNPADLDAQQAPLLKQLNATLFRNELNKEKCRRQAKNASWREGVRLSMRVIDTTRNRFVFGVLKHKRRR